MNAPCGRTGARIGIEIGGTFTDLDPAAGRPGTGDAEGQFHAVGPQRGRAVGCAETAGEGGRRLGRRGGNPARLDGRHQQPDRTQGDASRGGRRRPRGSRTCGRLACRRRRGSTTSSTAARRPWCRARQSAAFPNAWPPTAAWCRRWMIGVAAVREAVEAFGATSIAIVFLHAYRNPVQMNAARGRRLRQNSPTSTCRCRPTSRRNSASTSAPRPPSSTPMSARWCGGTSRACRMRWWPRAMRET